MSSKPRLVDLRGGRNIPPPSADEIKPRSPRRSNLRIQRRRFRAVITAGVCVVALLTSYAVHVASYLPRFTMQNVSVVGGSALAPAEIQKFVDTDLGQHSQGFISGRNIFIFDVEILEKDLTEHFPRIQTVHVSRDSFLGNSLIVTVDERKPFGRWCDAQETSCYILDREGVVFALLTDASTTLPSSYKFVGALSTSTQPLQNVPLGGVYAAGHFAGIIQLLTLLEDLDLHPQGAVLENETDFTVPLNEGYYLKVSYGETPADVGRNLSLIINADAIKNKTDTLEYIDLRFGNRVYYRFRAGAEVSANAKPVDRAKVSQ